MDLQAKIEKDTIMERTLLVDQAPVSTAAMSPG